MKIMIFHIFHKAYEDLATRQKIRQNMWNRPGWDTCVANTGMSYLYEIMESLFRVYFGLQNFALNRGFLSVGIDICVTSIRLSLNLFPRSFFKGILKRNNVRLLAITHCRSCCKNQWRKKNCSWRMEPLEWCPDFCATRWELGTFLEDSSFPRSNLIIICNEKEFHLTCDENQIYLQSLKIMNSHWS